jgi:nucleoside-diphosphate-sugar epimerase
MRVLVVAGTGFIGGHAVRAFVERGDRVSALVRSRARAENDPRLRDARLIEGSVGALPEAVLDEACDAVVYAAGVWRRNDRPGREEIMRRCEEVYVRGVEALAERALAWKAHFVFTSGITRYGEADWQKPLREDARPGKLLVYGEYKRRSEAILERLAERGLRWTAIVPHEVYGAHDPGIYLRFVYDRIRQRRFVLLGGGENRWSICNVRNVADAIAHVAGGEGAGPLNIADAQPWSQREVAEAVARALGRRAWLPSVPRSLALAAASINTRIPRPAWLGSPFSTEHVRARTMTMVLDTSRAARFGVLPRFGLEEGVREAIAWWASLEKPNQ